MKQVNSILDLLGGKNPSPLKNNKASSTAFQETFQQHFKVAKQSSKKTPLGHFASEPNQNQRSLSLNKRSDASPLKAKSPSVLDPQKNKPLDPETKKQPLGSDKEKTTVVSEKEKTDAPESNQPADPNAAAQVAWLPMEELMLQMEVNPAQVQGQSETVAEEQEQALVSNQPLPTEVNAAALLIMADETAPSQPGAEVAEELPTETLNKVLQQLEVAIKQGTENTDDMSSQDPVMSMLLNRLRQTQQATTLQSLATLPTSQGLQQPALPPLDPQVLLKFAKELLGADPNAAANNLSMSNNSTSLFQTLLNEAVATHYEQGGQQDQSSSQFQQQQTTSQTQQSAPASPQGAEQTGKFSLLAEGYQDKINVIQQLVDKMRLMHHNGQREMQVLLKPHDLGQVHMRLMEQQGKFNLHLIAESQATQQLLESTIGQLKQNFEAQGIRLEQVLIQFTPNQTQSGGQSKEHDAQRSKEQASPKRIAKVSDESDEEWNGQSLTPAQQHMLKSYMVNYLV